MLNLVVPPAISIEKKVEAVCSLHLNYSILCLEFWHREKQWPDRRAPH